MKKIKNTLTHQKSSTPFVNEAGIAHLLLILVSLVLIVGGVYYYINSKKPTLPPLQYPPTKTQEEIVASQAQVAITSKGFMPATIKIKKGTQITWTNTDNRAHRVSSDPHPYHTNLAGLDSPALLANQTFSFNFESIGTYTYHDHLNPLSFKGEIIVE